MPLPARRTLDPGQHSKRIFGGKATLSQHCQHSKFREIWMNADHKNKGIKWFKWLSASKTVFTLLGIQTCLLEDICIYYMHCRKTPIHSPSNRRPHWLSACLPCRSLVQLCINTKLEKKNMHAECFTKSNRDAMSMCHWMSNAESYIILLTQGRVVRLWRAILLILLDLLALSCAFNCCARATPMKRGCNANLVTILVQIIEKIYWETDTLHKSPGCPLQSVPLDSGLTWDRWEGQSMRFLAS